MMRKGPRGMQPSFTKPVNATARANQVTSLGKMTPENKSEWESARDMLHATVTNRKFRQFAHEGNIQEESMLCYVDLCVRIGDMQCMRDGLFHYRTISQHANATSLEKVLTHLMDTANEILAEDQDNQNSLKLVWECHKQVLELIKTTPKLDDCYHQTARKAIDFCVQYDRPTEFKRLCDILRWHFNNMLRVKNKADKAALLNSTLHIETKARQLDAACSLKLWRVAHDTTLEMDTLGIHENAPKMTVPGRMSGVEALTAYHRGCSEVLWYSSNSESEHAAALWKLFQHQRANIPGFKGSEEEQRLADNLIFATASSANEDLLELISRKGASDAASTEVSDLLDYLNFHEPEPHMCKVVQQLLNTIEENSGSNPTVVRYFSKIKEIVLTRLVGLLQGVYVTLSLEVLRGTLIPEEFMEWHAAEFVLMNLSRNGATSVCIDRKNKGVTFAHSSRYNAKGGGSNHEMLYNTAKSLDAILQHKTQDAQARADKITTFYDKIRAEAKRETEMFTSRMELARKTLEDETMAAKQEADHARQADVRRREELQRLEEDRQARAAKREEEQRQMKMLDGQRTMIAVKIKEHILSEIPKNATPVKIRNVEIDKIEVADIANQKYTFEEIDAAIKKMKERERNSIKSVREKEERTVDYTARAVREESLALWKLEEEKMRSELEACRPQFLEAAQIRHKQAHESFEAKCSIVEQLGMDTIEAVAEHINNTIMDDFEVKWPAFKSKVNKMILKQSVNQVKLRISKAQPLM